MYYDGFKEEWPQQSSAACNTHHSLYMTTQHGCLDIQLNKFRKEHKKKKSAPNPRFPAFLDLCRRGTGTTVQASLAGTCSPPLMIQLSFADAEVPGGGK